MKLRTLGWFALGTGLLAVVGCPAGWSDVCDDGACDAVTNPDGGGDVIAKDGGIDAPPGCDPTGDPKDNPACIADSFGVFVDATKGDDATGDGTKSKPLQTIGKGLEKVGNKPRVYICEGTYAEDVVLDSAHQVSLIGGLKCGDWSYSGMKAVVGKGTLALKIDSVKSAIWIADLDVKAADGAKAGDSSVAAFVNASDAVTFLRAKLEAGIGVTGTNGTLTSFTYPAQSDLDGNAADGGAGGLAKVVTCPDGQKTTGGKGGDITNIKGDDGLPALGGGTGGSPAACLGSNTGGANGTAASAAAAGAGASVLGQLASSTWTPGAGTNGPNGGPGQGGGGGASTTGAGGSGGAGGCGGAGGGAGKGGGGSVALVSVASTVMVSASELNAGTAGDGGNGVTGQGGQPIFGFYGAGKPPGCIGGNGGPGGAGGSGGGGAGGVSVGVLWKGAAAPTIDPSTTAKTTFAAKGSKGLGGATPTNDGIDGVAQAVLEVK